MNVHGLLGVIIVATSTIAVLLTAAILELVRVLKETKRTAREHREEVARLEARVGRLHEGWKKEKNDNVRLRRQMHEQRMKNLHK